MLHFPNAKINIGLDITEKRPDGFHNIETVFYPIELQDILEITPANKTNFENTGITVDAKAEDNLVMKVVAHFSTHYNTPPVFVQLHKQIPFGAGLGGGSADAAFAATLMNRLFELNLNNHTLTQIVSSYGSDCAFFIENQPAYGTGKGDELSPISVNLSGYWLVLANPGIHVPTPVAYASVKPQKPKLSLRESILQPITEWQHLIKNNFEASIFPKYPEISAIKTKLYKLGAVYAQMTGSGSSVFGIFTEKPQTKGAFGDYFVWEGAL